MLPYVDPLGTALPSDRGDTEVLGEEHGFGDLPDWDLQSDSAHYYHSSLSILIFLVGVVATVS